MKYNKIFKGCLTMFLAINSFLIYAQNLPDTNSVLPNPTGSGPGSVAKPPNYINGLGTVYPTEFNYSREYVPLSPMSSIPNFSNTSSLPIHIITSYTDGFGLPLMTINRNGSSTDIIKAYDNRAHGISVDYLAYPDSAYSKFQMKPFEDQASYYLNRYPNEKQTAYSKTIIDTLNGLKVTKRFAPGIQNVGMERGVITSGHTNDSSELIYLYYTGSTICKSGYYPPHSLMVTKTVGIHGQEVIEYRDKSNRFICKKVKDNNSSIGNTGGYLYTYYLYNELGKITHIIPPKAFAQFYTNTCLSNLASLCYMYQYDRFGNVIKKNTPEKSLEEDQIYDVNYRSVMSRSANQKATDKWSFVIYDKIGRPVITGIYSGTESESYWRDVVVGNTTPVNRGVPQDQTLEYWLLNRFSGSTYPTSLAGCEIYSYNYYDRYDLLPSGIPTSFDNSFSNDYLTGTDMVTPTPYMLTNGKLIATKSRILDNGYRNNFTNTPWVTSVMFYDEHGRLIQTQTLNPWNASVWDIATCQYNFAGNKVLDIATYNLWATSDKPFTKVMNKYTFGSLTGRLETVTQKVDTGLWQPISGYNYDEMGQVKVKWLGNVEEQIYDYDIQGRSLGVNIDDVDDVLNGVVNTPATRTYYEKLSYDHGYSQQRYDDAISGFMWKTRGSSLMSYGYEYDDANRMQDAEFVAYDANSYLWTDASIDFSVHEIDYDINGNMLNMTQRGYDANMLPIDIDVLSYTYDNGNRLIKVVDSATTPSAAFIKDFDNGSTGNNNDYNYDYNGNLSGDANKSISTILYNHLDLPQQITAYTGSVRNIYTTGGTLLTKLVYTTVVDTFVYWGPFVFKNSELQYMKHPEGRARYDANNDKFTYDFFVKDHLNNVRTVVEGSSSYDQIDYHAGWEIISASVEEGLFDQIGEVRDNKPVSSPGDLQSGKLNGSIADNRIGAALLVHTMAGDLINLKAYGYYEQEEPNGYNMYATDQAMLSSLTTALGDGVASGEGGSATQTINNLLSANNYAAYDALKQSVTNSNYPRAYLNFLVFNEQFEIQTQYCKVVQIQGGANTWLLMETPNQMTMPISGYVMAYLSNESPMNVWVDNEHLIQYNSNLLDENNYYPHGLTFSMSSQNVTPENKFLHQGKELQSDCGLEWYDFHARQYDPQVGRFWGVDPAEQFPSGYTGMGNNPANMVDPTGMFAVNNGSSGTLWNMNRQANFEKSMLFQDKLFGSQIMHEFPSIESYFDALDREKEQYSRSQLFYEAMTREVMKGHIVEDRMKRYEDIAATAKSVGGAVNKASNTMVRPEDVSRYNELEDLKNKKVISQKEFNLKALALQAWGPGSDKYTNDLSLEFDGKKLSLFQNNMIVDSWPAVSGKPSSENLSLKRDYSVAHQKVPFDGPIPEGNYHIYPMATAWRADQNMIDYAIANIFKGFRKGPWGEARTSIYPDPGTETYGRRGFFIHGGEVAGSAGCIDLTSYDRDFFNTLDYFNQGRYSFIPLKVDY